MAEKYPFPRYSSVRKCQPVCEAAEGHFLSYLTTNLPKANEYCFYSPVVDSYVFSPAIKKSLFGLETYLITSGEYKLGLAGSTVCQNYRNTINRFWEVELPVQTFDGAILRPFDPNLEIDKHERRIKMRILKSENSQILKREAVEYVEESEDSKVINLVINLLSIHGF